MKKYRLVVSKDKNFPYLVEKKFLVFWQKVDTFASERQAIEFIKDSFGKKPPGTVIAEYSEADYIAEKLSGKK